MRPAAARPAPSSRAISAHIRGSSNQPVAPRSIHHVPKLRSAHWAVLRSSSRLVSSSVSTPSAQPGKLARAQVRPRVVLVEPHLAGQGDAFRRRHGRAALAQAAIEVGDRRAEHVDVGAIEHAPQAHSGRRWPVRCGSPRTRTRSRRRTPPACVRAVASRAGPGELAHAVGHHLLLELGEVDQRSLGDRDRGARRPARRGGRRATGTAAVASVTCGSRQAACRAASSA